MKKLLLGSIFFCAMSCFGHPDRIRYIDPKMQKAYEEHCRANKGYTIPPEPRRSSSGLTSSSSSGNASQSSVKPTKSLKKTKSNLSPSAVVEISNLGNNARVINSTTSTSYSSSPSSVSSAIKSPVFISSGWFWNEELGWVYLHKKSYPYYYSHNNGKWLKFIDLR